MKPAQIAYLLSPTIDPDAKAWRTAVQAAGYSIGANSLRALSNLFKSAKAGGYFERAFGKCFGPLCGGELGAALFQRVNGVWTQATSVNYVAGDYTEATGLTATGTTKYLKTGLIPSTSLTANDTHLALYKRNTVNTQMGVDGTDAFLLYLLATWYSDQYNATTGRISVVPAAVDGFGIGSRTASNAHALYRNGVAIQTGTGSGGNLPGYEVYVNAYNTAGVAGGIGAASLGAYSIGSGLTASQAAAYNTHMEAFQDALGRGVQ